MLKRLVSFLVLLVPTLAIGAGDSAGSLPDLPDLDVTFIERLPRYPSYEIRYEEGLPVVLRPGSDVPLAPEEWDGVQRQPLPGEEVRFVGHVVNHGSRETGPFAYTWRIDGEEVDTGRIDGLRGPARAQGKASWAIEGRTYEEAPLAAGTSTNLVLTWRWKPGRHRVELEVALESDAAEEITLENNRLEDATDALAFVILVRARNYNGFTRVAGPLGSGSFEDWVQYHFGLMREKFAESVYPSAPDGIEEDVRIDMIKILADSEPRDTINPLKHAAGWDGYWDFANYQDPERDALVKDWALIHELGHQLGLIDLYNLDTIAADNEVLDEDGFPVAIGHRTKIRGMMRGHGDVPFSEHSTLALNRMKGKRRGYFGAYLYDIPKENRLLVLDSAGKPVPGTLITAWQTERRRVPSRVLFGGQTDERGEFVMPDSDAPVHRTAIGPVLRPNPFGRIDVVGTNGLLFLRLEARGHVEWRWLEITEFNLACWHGDRDSATYPIRTAIPPVGAPEPPDGLRVKAIRDGEEVRTWIRWTPSDPAPARYRIERGWNDEYLYETVADVAGNLTSFGEIFSSGMPAPVARYRVSAVDVEGRRGAAAGPAAVAVLREAGGLGILPDGRILVCDPKRNSPLMLRPDGEPIGGFSSDGNQAFPTDLAVAPEGWVAMVDMPDGYNAFHRLGFLVCDATGQVRKRFETNRGSGPEDLLDPRGIAVDDEGRIFLVDTGNHRVLVFDESAEQIAEFGGMGSGTDEFLWPSKIACAGGELAVADAGNGRVVLYLETAPNVFQQDDELGGFVEPTYVVYGPDGFLYVCDRSAGRILAFDEERRIQAIYSGDSDHGPFLRPESLAFDREGRMIVADGQEGWIRILPPDRLTPVAPARPPE